MKLNPQQAPLYGDCVVTVLLAEEDKVEEDVVFYLVFSGSTLHHCASTRKVSSDTLETIAPGHDCCETVKVLLCASRGGLPVSVVAEQDFRFVQDEAYDAAQFLATSAGNQQALNFTRFLDRSGPPSGDVNSLDEKVALAFRHLKLPAEWNVLGTDEALHDAGPRETLMHFAVRLGLLRLTWFLLQKPGGRGALSIHNQEGATPVSLALERGYHQLHQLLTQENAGEPDSWSSLSYEIPCGDCSVRHHRELDVYTLTSESEARQEPPTSGDSCTGHIFKLMNIQQQLMKTNLKQMDHLVPLTVTAQDPCSPPSASAQETDGCFLPCAPEPSGSQRLPPPPGETESAACCQGGPAGQSDCGLAPQSVAEGENRDHSSVKEQGTEGKGEEVEPAHTGDSGVVSGQEGCLQSEPGCGVGGSENFPSRGDRHEETGRTCSGMATGQESVCSGASVPRGDVVVEPGTGCPAGELAGDLATEVCALEAAGAAEGDLEHPAAPMQKKVLQGGKHTAERSGNSEVRTAGASDAQVTGKPGGRAAVPNGASASTARAGAEPATAALAVSGGESSVAKAADTETPRRAERNADVLVDTSSPVTAGAAEDRISGGSEPDSALADVGRAVSCWDITVPGPEDGATGDQQSEANSSAGSDPQDTDPLCLQGAVPSSGECGAQHCSGRVTQPQSTPGGQPNAPDASSAVGCEDPQATAITSDPGGDSQEREDTCPLGISDKMGQRKDLKLDTPAVNLCVDVSPPHEVVPKTEKEMAPARAVTSGSAVSLAGGPGSESVTKDDALSPVSSQKEKGTATPPPHTATDGGEGQDGEPSGPVETGREDLAAGLPTSSPASQLQPGMGNTSPTGLGGEHEDPGSSANPEARNVQGDTECALQTVGEPTLAPGSALTEEEKTLVVPDSPAAQGQDDTDKTGTCSSIKEDTLSSGALQGEQRVLPPGLETRGLCKQPSSAACAQDKALQDCHSLGTPSACLKMDTKHDKEVAPQPGEGLAAGSLVSPGAKLAVEALTVEQDSSTLLPGLWSEGSQALHSLPLALGVEVKTPPPQDGAGACEVSVEAAQGPARPSSKDLPDEPLDIPLPRVLPRLEKNASQGLPGPLPDSAPTDLLAAAAPETLPLDWQQGRLEGADHSCTTGDSREEPVDDEAQQLIPQGTPTEPALVAQEDEAPTGMKERRRASAPGRDRGAPSPPRGVSAQGGPLPRGADSIEEAATRIVEAVMERVRASGALAPEGQLCCPEWPEEAPTERGHALPPRGTSQTGSVLEEAAGHLAGHFAGQEASEKSLPVQGPASTTEMPDMKAEDEVDFLSHARVSSVSAEVAVGSGAPVPKMRPGPESQAINRESWCSLEPCPDAASLLASKQGAECEKFLDGGLGGECAPKQAGLQSASGSDPELFASPSDGVGSILFSEPSQERSASDILGSSSSAEDAASPDQHSSRGGDVSLPQVAGLNRSGDEQSPDGFASLGMGAEGRESENEPGGGGEVEEEEEMDSITDVPASCSVLRGSMRPLSPFRRHSWGPGKNTASDAEMNQRSSVRVLGDVVRRPPIHRRSMSWCPSGVQYSAALSADCNYRSFSLEGLAGGAALGNKPSLSLEGSPADSKERRHPSSREERGGSLLSLSEEDLESDPREHGVFDHQMRHRSKQQGFNYCTAAIASPLTKSVSLMTISHSGLDNSRSFHNTSAHLTESMTEESYNFLPQSPSKKDFEGKSGTKVSRTFSYIKNKMSSSKKSKEKDKEKEKVKEKEKDCKEKEKDKKAINGHCFSPIPVVGPVSCSQCAKPFPSRDAHTCTNCGAFVHKGCRESLASCAKVKMKPRGSLQAHDTSSLPTVIMRTKPSQPKERPRSAVLLAEETAAAPVFAQRRAQQSVSLSKSVSIQNITGVGSDESMSNTWKFLSHSTDSLNKISKVTESTESLTDEGVGTDMNEGQLMGDFEIDSRQLEAESWSRIVDSKFLRQQKKDVIKRQEVIYELMQTEFHHIRTLKIMSDVYSRGLVGELHFEQQMVDKLFPCLDELINIHSQFFQKILERKKESVLDQSENFLIQRIGDVLVNQFSGENAQRLKKTYGKFCGQHNQSVNYFKDLYTKEKRFQTFVKKKMSSSVVRRLGIPECILLVTQRITKYPVLFQRILQCTKDNEAEQEDLTQCLSLVKDVIGAVDSKVASYEKKARLSEFYTKTDSKSIMRMNSGQMFAKEDLKRKQLVRDGTVSLKSSTGRLKEVQAILLTDILVFLQEKDQKYIFASLDQKSTVISLKKLIVREVAHEEKGLFLISMGVKDPEMVEVHAGSKEERNSWIRTIQDTINTLNRDEDEGVPSENEEEKRMLDTRARELKEQLRQKDQQILLLLEEKEAIFRDLAECSAPLPEDCSPAHSPRALFRSSTQEALKGGPLMRSAMSEVEVLQGLVSGSLGGPLGQTASSPVGQEGSMGPVSLPRRAETFGGFDSHQMNASKGGEKEEGDDGQDLRRTESDSGLKKGGNAALVFTLKRNTEQVVQSVVHLHELLSALQGVVLQQDSYIEDQKLVLSERPLTRGASRPSSLVEQEKQRSLEKQRQDLANLQKQQAQHAEERRRREREWEARDRELQAREARLAEREEQVQRGQRDLEREQEDLQQRKGAYQCDLEQLRAAQRQLEREQERLRRDAERLGQGHVERDLCQVSRPHGKLMRIPSFLPSPEESSLPPAPAAARSGPLDPELSVSPKRNSLSRTHKDKGPFHILGSASQSHRGPEGPSLPPGCSSSSSTSSSTSSSSTSSSRLFGLAKPKEKKEKKKKSRGGRIQPGEGPVSEASAEGEEIFC
ncbi:A-kinase anchor protein 13 isoform X2 [Lepus europaeus]|uniref:A-kinase anchor protein 13 isoform X2 n=1 Tax=Lepus europaeus TaxID=9983 RepID=UPI002B47A28F|nr:A-kinase anchor protein 13 isoform X2 [Lepus europaeus]